MLLELVGVMRTLSQQYIEQKHVLTCVMPYYPIYNIPPKTCILCPDSVFTMLHMLRYLLYNRAAAPSAAAFLFMLYRTIRYGLRGQKITSCFARLRRNCVVMCPCSILNYFSVVILHFLPRNVFGML